MLHDAGRRSADVPSAGDQTVPERLAVRIEIVPGQGWKSGHREPPVRFWVLGVRFWGNDDPLRKPRTQNPKPRYAPTATGAALLPLLNAGMTCLPYISSDESTFSCGTVSVCMI